MGAVVSLASVCGATSLLATALLAGCDASPSTQGPTQGATQEPAQEPVPADISVTVLQQRVDEATRVVGVEATNAGDSVVHVTSVRLFGGGLDADATALDTELQPGLTVALRTSYGRPDCAERSDPVRVELDVDGRPVELAVDAAGQEEVQRLLNVDCAARTLAATARVQLSGPYRPVVADGAPRLRGRLVLDRRAAGAGVDVRSLGGSVIVDLRPVGEPVDLGPDTERAVTPVLLGSTGRCDAHALGGSTQTFLLSAYVRLGDAPEQRVVLVPPAGVQGRVLETVQRACTARP